MGDVIAILRHAREVDEEETRAKLFGSNGTRSAAPPTPAASSEKTVQAKNNASNTAVTPAPAASTTASAATGISDSLAKRLGPPTGSKRTAESVAAAQAKKRISGPTEETGSVPQARVVRLPSSGQSASVFARLGLSTNASTVTTGSELRAGKATATVKPTTVITKGSVMDRLGYKTESLKQAASNSNYTLKNQVKEVVTANSRAAAKPQLSSGRTISLKKSVFDRLGSWVIDHLSALHILTNYFAWRFLWCMN